MAKKGMKSLKGQGEIWPEAKKGVTLYLTPTGIDLLKNYAQRMGFSQSDFFERLLRGLIAIPKKGTLAYLILQWDTQELTERSGVSPERLKAIARGEEPHLSEVSRLVAPLEKSREELIAITLRDFPKQTQNPQATEANESNS